MFLLDVVYLITSSIVLFFYLSTLFVLSLFHHFTSSNKRNIHASGPAGPASTTTGGNPNTSRRVSRSVSPTPFLTHDTHDEQATPNPFDELLLMEDKRLVPHLDYYYKQYDIKVEKFEVETDDGFILDLLHFTSLSSPPNSESKKKYPILLLHGLLQSAGAFASGGRKSLAYYFHVSNFDVWLGNNRCGLKAKFNKKKVNSTKDKWGWNMHEMAKYDLKALISHVTEKTGFEKISLVAHSQGTTQTLFSLINSEKLYGNSDWKLIDKLDNFAALAPAIYPGPLLTEKLFVRFMSKSVDHPILFGNRSFIPMMMTMRDIMVGSKIFSFLSYVMFNYLFDWNDYLWDKELRNRHFLFSPVHISNRLMQWWLSPNPTKISFKFGAHILFPDDKIWFPIDNEYLNNNKSKNKNKNKNKRTDISDTDDYIGNNDNNKEAFEEGKEMESKYRESLDIQTPARSDVKEYPKLLFFIPERDRLVNNRRLIDHFINYEDHKLFKLWLLREYSHLDVLWAHDVIDAIGKPLVNSLRLPEGYQIEVDAI